MAHRRSKSRKEVKSLTVKELRAKARDLEEHLFQLKMQWKTGQLASPAMMKMARMERARVQTAIREKSVAATK